MRALGWAADIFLSSSFASGVARPWQYWDRVRHRPSYAKAGVVHSLPLWVRVMTSLASAYYGGRAAIARMLKAK